MLEEGGFNPVGFGEVLELIDHYDALGTAKAKAQEFADNAKQCLENLPDTPYKDALRSLPDFMLDREC
jgi:geranylgeranyl pyrophosphate synthase